MKRDSNDHIMKTSYILVLICFCVKIVKAICITAVGSNVIIRPLLASRRFVFPGITVCGYINVKSYY